MGDGVLGAPGPPGHRPRRRRLERDERLQRFARPADRGGQGPTTAGRRWWSPSSRSSSSCGCTATTCLPFRERAAARWLLDPGLRRHRRIDWDYRARGRHTIITRRAMSSRMLRRLTVDGQAVGRDGMMSVVQNAPRTLKPADVDLERSLEQHRSELTGYCYRMLGSPFEAEDAVQETLIRAWRNHDRFEGRAALRSWLYRIATNVCLDMLGSRERRARPMDLGPAQEPIIENLNTLPEVTWIQPIPDPATWPSRTTRSGSHSSPPCSSSRRSSGRPSSSARCCTGRQRRRQSCWTRPSRRSTARCSGPARPSRLPTSAPRNRLRSTRRTERCSNATSRLSSATTSTRSPR